MSSFERYLTVWVFLCIVVGIALGRFLPTPFQLLDKMEVAKVNLPVGQIDSYIAGLILLAAAPCTAISNSR